MEWEAWAERVPFDGFKRPLLQFDPHEFEQIICNNPLLVGVPVCYTIDGPWLKCWPIPEPGWVAKAFRAGETCSFMLTREAAVQFVEGGGPW